jgi:hypothetical protein
MCLILEYKLADEMFRLEEDNENFIEGIALLEQLRRCLQRYPCVARSLSYFTFPLPAELQYLRLYYFKYFTPYSS